MIESPPNGSAHQGVARLVIEVPPPLKNQFKSRAAASGLSMRDALMQLISSYVGAQQPNTGV